MYDIIARSINQSINRFKRNAVAKVKETAHSLSKSSEKYCKA